MRLAKGTFLGTLLLLALASCAHLDDPLIRQSREHSAAGRAEQAVQVMQKATRENPERLDYRSEYFRVRELAVMQWLAQAELLRSSGQSAWVATSTPV